LDQRQAHLKGRAAGRGGPREWRELLERELMSRASSEAIVRSVGDFERGNACVKLGKSSAGS
jgi:hypothetical protein